ncbi:MAG: undecaprenyl-phosphate glucose phosphotransferase [Bacteroidetes bacterium]|nr:undecaprenyl-phosphate glucose phosphotransferase [Bacteroidota bacterium]
MHSRYSKFFYALHFTSDLIILNFSFLLGYLIRFGTLDGILGEEYLRLAFFVNLFWVFSASVLKIYALYRAVRVEKILFSLFRAVALLVAVVAMYIWLAKGDIYSRQQLVYTFISFMVLVTSWRLIYLHIIRLVRSSGFNFRRIIIIGAGPVGVQMLDQLNTHSEYGYKFLGFFDDNPENSDAQQLILGDVEEAKLYAIQNQIDEIYCALPPSATEKIMDLITFSDKNLMRFKIIPDFRGFLNKKVKMEFYGFLPVLTIRNEPLENVVNRVIKRTFDIIFSTLVLVFIMSWLFPLIAVIIKLTSKGPVLFKQKRTGIRNQYFECWKFRTMYVNDEADTKQATKDDPRVTPVGRFLRKSNLDEMPQFINVLMGHMSVVGPRPHMLKHTEEYSKIIDKFMVRHLIKPGITGLAQVRGHRGETIDPVAMQKRVQNDVWYIENWSFLLELKIVFLTVLNMVRGDKNAV